MNSIDVQGQLSSTRLFRGATLIREAVQASGNNAASGRTGSSQLIP